MPHALARRALHPRPRRSLAIATAAALLLLPIGAKADAVIDAAACTITAGGQTFPLAGKVQHVDTFPGLR